MSSLNLFEYSEEEVEEEEVEEEEIEEEKEVEEEEEEVEEEVEEEEEKDKTHKWQSLVFLTVLVVPLLSASSGTGTHTSGTGIETR